MARKKYSDWPDDRKTTHMAYDKKYYSVLGCKLPRPIADDFRRYCADHGITVSAALAAYIRDTLGAGGDPAGESDPAETCPAVDTAID